MPVQDHPLLTWIDSDRDLYLQELLRHDGRGDYLYDVVCRNCQSNTPGFRCRDVLEWSCTAKAALSCCTLEIQCIGFR